MPQFELRIHEQQRDFQVTRQGDQLHIRAEGLTVDAHIVHQADGMILIRYEDAAGRPQQIRLAGTRQGDKRQLWVNGRLLPVERVRRRGSIGSAELGSLVAAIPAVVSQILVEAGDTVRAGDKLILLESMKMVIPIQAPYDGLVTRILCAAGDSVPANIPLVEIEPQ
ncbi:MAG: biotin/lipoyl-containing protein [Chloroflexota bacterium]|jgi:biotin carboxyl carrier protein